MHFIKKIKKHLNLEKIKLFEKLMFLKLKK